MDSRFAQLTGVFCDDFTYSEGSRRFLSSYSTVERRPGVPVEGDCYDCLKNKWIAFELEGQPRKFPKATVRCILNNDATYVCSEQEYQQICKVQFKDYLEIDGVVKVGHKASYDAELRERLLELPHPKSSPKPRIEWVAPPRLADISKETAELKRQYGFFECSKLLACGEECGLDQEARELILNEYARDREFEFRNGGWIQRYTVASHKPATQKILPLPASAPLARELLMLIARSTTQAGKVLHSDNTSILAVPVMRDSGKHSKRRPTASTHHLVVGLSKPGCEHDFEFDGYRAAVHVMHLDPKQSANIGEQDFVSTREIYKLDMLELPPISRKGDLDRASGLETRWDVILLLECLDSTRVSQAVAQHFNRHRLALSVCKDEFKKGYQLASEIRGTIPLSSLYYPLCAVRLRMTVHPFAR
uniref:Uncharacterized protein n=1 Tax=Tilapia lake virus TaxID=1549864 RepID=A0A7G3SAG1_9VIRU|nr:hypothetical protein [Tilapia lake virus]